MLRNVASYLIQDPVLKIMCPDGDPTPTWVREGVYTLDHFNFEHTFDSTGWNTLRDYNDPIDPDNVDHCEYGVCDSIDQFFDHPFGKMIADHPKREFVVAFTHVPKGVEDCGWRWHKWGPYIGKGEPQCEYLNDEEGFEDGVWVYHVYERKGR